MNEITYDWELFDADDQWQAGGSCPDMLTAKREAQHYLLQYEFDGPHHAVVYQRTVVLELRGGE